MSARSAAAIASLVLLAASAACTNFYEVPIETPIQAKLDVAAFRRVLVAGFISGGTDDVDANLETVRLLRSQLRSKTTLRVIEAEVLPLVELANEHASKSGAAGSSATSDVPAEPSPTAKPQTPAAAPDGAIRSRKDLERYERIFADAAFWKKIGEEYEMPLIVTGTIMFTPQQTSGFVPVNREVYDNLGRRSVIQQRVYQERKGFILEPKFVFIDGRTGATLHSETYRREILHATQQTVPALATYFELMDQLIPDFLGALSTQKIRGMRTLLR